MKVALNQSDANHVTNDKGVAFITGLRPYLPVDVQISSRSIEDPFLRPGVPGVRFTPRAAKTAQVALPLVIVGQTDGNVNMESGGTSYPKRAIVVELLDTSGKLLATQKTDRDGFYQFEAIFPGPYLVRLSQAQLDKLGLVATPAVHSVTIPEEGSFESNQDFTLRKK